VVTANRFLTLLCGLVLSGLAATTGQSSPIKDGRAEVAKGVQLHYLEAGDSKADSALVFIPGWRLPAYLWNEQLKTFSKNYRVIAIDSRSQGSSTVTTDGNSPEVRARDLHAFLGSVGIAHAVLVGWSQGRKMSPPALGSSEPNRSVESS